MLRRMTSQELASFARVPEIGKTFTEGAGLEELFPSMPNEEGEEKSIYTDEFDSDTVKYVAIGGVATILGVIGVVAAKRLNDKRKDS